MGILLEIPDVTATTIFREPVRKQLFSCDRFDRFIGSNQPRSVQTGAPIPAKAVTADVKKLPFAAVLFPFSDQIPDTTISRVVTFHITNHQTSITFVGRSQNPFCLL